MPLFIKRVRHLKSRPPWPEAVRMIASLGGFLGRKGDCTYGVQLLGTLKYDRIDIQSKVFDSANCIPTVDNLFNNCANTTKSGSIARLGNTKAK